jgi:hypothetical protein
MKALTMWQPHASLLALGVRTIETRSWGTDYRGPLVIHAAVRWNAQTAAETNEAARLMHSLAVPLTGLGHAFAAIEYRKTLGCVLAIADLVDCRPIPEREGTDLDRLLGGFGRGRIGWFLERPRLVVPARRTGAQGLWECAVDGLEPFTAPGDESPRALFTTEELRAC